MDFVTPDLPRPEFGEGLLARLTETDLTDQYVVIGQEIPWRFVEEDLAVSPVAVELVTSVDQGALDALEARCPPVKLVVGLGGGMAIDSAKYVAWKREIPLLAVPTVISVDAPFCRAIGIRKNWFVEYVGDKMPDRLLVDYAVIQHAPPALNRGGICDIISIWTALEDWKIAHEQTEEAYDAGVAGQSRTILDVLMQNAAAIRGVTSEGIQAIVEGFLAEVDLCEQWGNARPEEGAEHFFAYALEYYTHKPYLHSAIVSLGVVLMTVLQDRDPTPIIDFIDACGVEWRPSDTGIPLSDIELALTRLKEFVEEHALPYSVINARALDAQEVAVLVKNLKTLDQKL